MKKTKSSTKYVQMWNGVVGTTNKVLIFASPDYPCTVRGLRWKIHATTSNKLSEDSTVAYAWNTTEGQDKQTIISPLSTTASPYKFLAQGAASNLISSGFLYSTYGEVATVGGAEHILYADARESTKTNTIRKLRRDDELQCILRGNSSIGTNVTIMATYWLIT